MVENRLGGPGIFDEIVIEPPKFIGIFEWPVFKTLLLTTDKTHQSLLVKLFKLHKQPVPLAKTHPAGLQAPTSSAPNEFQKSPARSPVLRRKYHAGKSKRCFSLPGKEMKIENQHVSFPEVLVSYDGRKDRKKSLFVFAGPGFQNKA